MQDYSQPVVTHKTPHRSIGFVYILPLGLLVGFLVFVGVFFYKGGGNNFTLPTFQTTTPTPTGILIAPESPAPEKEPTPTQTASDAATLKTDIAIKVLNGSGAAGVAAKGKVLLEDAGYENVTTGNAEEYDFTDVTIRYRQEVAGSIPSLTKTLEEKYTVSDTEAAEMSGSTDVEVIIGK